MPSESMDKFKDLVQRAKHVLILTGAGVSAESNIPTFRGAGGFWRKYDCTSLATPTAFKKNPSLVWEFYHYRRELVSNRKPNKAHYAIAEFEKRSKIEGRIVNVITQNVDGLHKLAGTENLLELHGSLFKTKCLKCNDIQINTDSPITPALKGRGSPDIESSPPIAESDLPRCKNENCGGLLRPAVVWFNECLDSKVLSQAEKIIVECDVCLVIGTSAVVYPAASFVPRLKERNVPVAEFNIEQTPNYNIVDYFFEGLCSETLPNILRTS